MAHCAQGVGPVHFGNDALDSGTTPASADPERDVFTALQRWVEQGTAPERLIGSGPSPLDASKTMTRPLCPYPQQARYRSSGDINDAANFTCALPAK
jgi:feruloyl esterase